MKHILLRIMAILLLSGSANAAVNGIETFGSKQVTLEQILKVAKEDIEVFVETALSGKKELAEKSHNSAMAKIEKLAPFALVKLSFVQYPPPTPAVYVTVDLVDPADRDSRMNFLQPPKGTFPDPAHLLAEWDKYQAAGMRLLMSGELKPTSKCPAFHCVAGFDHPTLKRFGKLFKTEVPKHEEQLIKILHKDKVAQHRANAAFLLAHTHDAKKLVKELALNIRDDSDGVRNNVLRVFGYLGEFHPEVDLPAEAIAQALNFPTATDRNKALFALYSIAKRPDKRRYLIQSCGPLLVSILKLQQPNNHDPAYLILKSLSGKDFGERDYAAWENWLKTT